MRFLSLILSCLMLTACATTTAATDSRAEVSPSSLKPGECGLFGWSTGNKRDFVFFADEETARYNSVQGPVDLVPQSVFPSLEYLDAAGRPVALRLGRGEAMNGGMRYPGARLVTVSEEGWERLQPVALVQACQP